MGDIKGFMKFERQTPDIQDPHERVQHFEEHYENLSEEGIKTQASRCMDCGVPFCMSGGCPLAT